MIFYFFESEFPNVRFDFHHLNGSFTTTSTIKMTPKKRNALKTKYENLNHDRVIMFMNNFSGYQLETTPKPITHVT